MTRNLTAFSMRVAITVSISVLFALLLALAWAASDVLLLIFAAVLFACMLRGLSQWVSRWTKLSPPWALSLVVVSLLIIVSAGISLLAPRVGAQVDDLSHGITESLQQLYTQISRYEWGRQLLAGAPGIVGLARRADILSRVTGVFSSTLGAILNIVLVLFVGFYLAAAPHIYQNGIAALFPAHRRERIAEILNETGATLQRWLIGRAILMLSNGVFTFIGLWFLGIPLAVTLATLAGLLNFVPNFGPIIAAVPAVLIGWTISPAHALYVVLLYFVLQSADGYIFTPLVQQRTVALPPALIITAQVLFGVLAGTTGVLLATPLTATALVLVRRLYIEDLLGERDRS